MFRRVLFVVVLALALVGLLGAAVLAAETGTKQVGLVILFPDGKQHLEVVTVPVTATTFDVLQAAKIELVSQNTNFGPAICSINKVGCPATNCFCDPKRFWAYFHLEGTAWKAAGEGAGAYTPANGAVEGFAWSEADANFNPVLKPPVYTFAQLAAGIKPVALPVTGVPVAGLSGIGLIGLGLIGLGLALRSRQAVD